MSDKVLYRMPGLRDDLSDEFLHNINIAAPPRDTSGTLAMDATARTYRYLDPSEVQAQRKAARPAGAKK
jgi:type IV pilus assembly protein PilO